MVVCSHSFATMGQDGPDAHICPVTKAGVSEEFYYEKMSNHGWHRVLCNENKLS